MDYFICICVAVALLAIMYRLIRRFATGGVCKSKARMDGKTVVITGANTGIGKETALDLARRGARVIMACRDMKKGEVALKDIKEKSGSTDLVLKQLDLGSLNSVRKFADDINNSEPKLHVLINNAGVMFIPELTKTEDGFEMTMGVNHLGHFLLTNLLLDLLKKSAPSRIVVVSSIGHSWLTKEMKFDNINGEKSYDKYDSYGQSKLANILFTRELAKRLKDSGVTANSLHPGAIKTELDRHINPLLKLLLSPTLIFYKTPEQGAQTNIHLAVSEGVEGVTGLYFADCKAKEPSKAAQDDGAAKKLWEVSADLVGLESTI